MKTWTAEEIEILAANYNRVSNVQLCELIPTKTPLAIYKKAYKMGFRKSPEIEFLNRSEARKGERAPNWNGGTRMTRCGYRQVLCPEHRRADSSGYVFEHIVTFERETGISVPSGCCIHHLNGIKDDNRIENLCLMTHGAHTAMHHTGAKRTEETKRKISERTKKHGT